MSQCHFIQRRTPWSVLIQFFLFCVLVDFLFSTCSVLMCTVKQRTRRRRRYAQMSVCFFFFKDHIILYFIEHSVILSKCVQKKCCEMSRLKSIKGRILENEIDIFFNNPSTKINNIYIYIFIWSLKNTCILQKSTKNVTKSQKRQ